MASSGKKKTTTAKLNRERRLQERRLDKQAKKDARKQASADHFGERSDGPTTDLGEPRGSAARQPNLEPVVQTAPDD